MRIHTLAQRDVLPLRRAHSKLVRPPHVTASPPMGLPKREPVMNEPYKAPPTTSCRLRQVTQIFFPDKTPRAIRRQQWT
jgi:hypothetical protein